MIDCSGPHNPAVNWISCENKKDFVRLQLSWLSNGYKFHKQEIQEDEYPIHLHYKIVPGIGGMWVDYTLH